ncbi:hypothetical protein BDF20DRAFT_874576 [Mycotypha africana]|uniref:uncharacterized protein n=1 Tax=Mycotypha africana TaxID=64632 RepID=UPI002301A621|nr:uncharacterized protein BDF20DRAFT_874576 [Mycotypha africana]KAI8977395.1 hypothetical protein BDF20DRAFT_874576 [Mycotypha africana]
MLNVYPIQLSQTPEFRIQLEDDEVCLHGMPEESAGVILRGSILLNCHEPLKVKSITMKLIGVTNVDWVEGSGSHQRRFREEHKVIEKEYTFLKLQKKPYHLSSGQYKWDFQVPLPGTLPETIHHEMGQVSYRLKAYCERPKFYTNYVDKKTIKVKRIALPSSSMEMSQSVIISNIWTDKVGYDISLPSKVFCTNKSIPISFDLVPIAPDLRVNWITCVLKEYVTCTTTSGSTPALLSSSTSPSSLSHSKTEGRIINYIRDDHVTIDETTGQISRTELLRVPDEDSSEVNYDMCSDLIQVKHKLKFTVSLLNADGHLSELRAAIPVVIAPLLPEDENVLPAYEDIWRSIPCNPELFAQMIALNGISAPPLSTSPLSQSPQLVASDSSSTLSSLSSVNSSSAISSSNNNSNRHDGSSFSEDDLLIMPPATAFPSAGLMGLDLSRCPSYSTALRTGAPSCALLSSLPSYESTIAA